MELVADKWVKAASERVADRYVLAADMRRILSQLYRPVQPYVKRWDQFLLNLATAYREDLEWVIPAFGDEWDSKLTNIGSGWYEWQGPQIGGYGYRGNRGYDPPEYAEQSVEVPSGGTLTLTGFQSLRRWPHDMARIWRSEIKDPKGFRDALYHMLENQASVKLLAKLTANAIQGAFRTGWADDWIVDLVSEEDWSDAFDMGWSGSVSLKETGRPVVRVTPQGDGFKMVVTVDVEVDVEDVEPPEPDVEPW